AAGPLVEHHELFAFLKAPQRRRQRADIHGLRGHLQEMVEEAPDFRIEHADILRPRRNLHAEELFERQHKAMLLIHRRDIIEPVEIAQRLHVGLVLDQLLGAAMKQTDMRVDTLDDLAVELQHQTQHAVGCGMLRPKIDAERALVKNFRHCASPANGEWRMANGEWESQCHSLSLLQRADEGAEHLSCRAALLQWRIDFRLRYYADPFRQQHVSLELLQRALRNTQKLDERLRVLPAMPFGDIGRNGGCRSADLRDQSEHLVLRKRQRQTIAALGKRHGFLPDSQVLIRGDLLIGQRAFLLATHHSLLATS